jgi:NADP-reducing hydrogenase subunit HndC
LLNSIEGKRGMPRPRPPFPAIKGLWGKPTCVNNVETLAQIPYIIRVGAAEYAKVGTQGSKGTKVFALGGKINNVGLVEVPMGTTLRTSFSISAAAFLTARNSKPFRPAVLPAAA